MCKRSALDRRERDVRGETHWWWWYIYIWKNNTILRSDLIPYFIKTILTGLYHDCNTQEGHNKKRSIIITRNKRGCDIYTKYSSYMHSNYQAPTVIKQCRLPIWLVLLSLGLVIQHTRAFILLRGPRSSSTTSPLISSLRPHPFITTRGKPKTSALHHTYDAFNATPSTCRY